MKPLVLQFYSGWDYVRASQTVRTLIRFGGVLQEKALRDKDGEANLGISFRGF